MNQSKKIVVVIINRKKNGITKDLEGKSKVNLAAYETLRTKNNNNE
jgi:hypothetical protein